MYLKKLKIGNVELENNIILNQKKYINDKSAKDLVQYVKKWM